MTDTAATRACQVEAGGETEPADRSWIGIGGTKIACKTLSPAGQTKACHDGSAMRLIENVIGSRTDDDIAAQLHRLEHSDAVDSLVIRNAEIERRRFRATTFKGDEIAIALPRDQSLHDGAVLVLEADYALVVRVSTPRWLRFVPRDAAAAVELGYNAGNLHWRVKFDGAVLMVAMEGPAESYRARLKGMITEGKVSVEGGDEAC
jgi:urease accessory protein